MVMYYKINTVGSHVQLSKPLSPCLLYNSQEYVASSSLVRRLENRCANYWVDHKLYIAAHVTACSTIANKADMSHHSVFIWYICQQFEVCMGIMYGCTSCTVDKYPANLLTMHSHSQLGPLKPPAQLHVQVPVSRVPPFWQVRVQANRQ